MSTAADRSARLLGVARIGIGVLILLRTTGLLAPLDVPWLRSAWPLLGWPTGGFDLAFLPPLAIQILCVVRTLSALLFTLGVAARPAGITCGIAGYLVAAQYPFGFFFTIHLLYQAAILLACTDAVSHYAFRPAAARSGPSGLWLMRAFVASIYAWAGIYKLRGDWLDGRTLELFHVPGAIHGALADSIFRVAWLPALLAKLIALVELALGPLLLWPRTRRFALVAAYALHATLELTAHPDLLGWAMMVLLLAFVPARGAMPAHARASTEL